MVRTLHASIYVQSNPDVAPQFAYKLEGACCNNDRSVSWSNLNVLTKEPPVQGWNYETI